MAKILIIDDDQLLCESLTCKLQDMGHEVLCAYSLQEALHVTQKEDIDVVYLDVRLPDGNGLEKIPQITNSKSEPEVIIMTGQGDPDGAELAIKNGAWDYLEKPSALNKMILPLVRAIQYRDIKKAKKTPVVLRREDIVGNSPPMRTCLDQIAQASVSDLSVLITGATGTGKELVAWAIHNNSSRSDHDFVVVDCASLSETLVESVLFGHEKGAYTGADKSHVGLIKQADHGTLFLDEIGELPLSIQKSFLRVLQMHRFRPLGSKKEINSDFRVIAATNRNLDEMVANGLYRSDLLYRLRSFQIELPSLQDHKEDIVELFMFHMDKICKHYGARGKLLSPEFLDILQAYPWPGNVRELVNAVELSLSAARHESMLFPKHLPTHIRVFSARENVKTNNVTKDGLTVQQNGTIAKWQDYRETAMVNIGKDYLHNLLSQTGDDINEACKLSGLSRSRLYDLLKKYRN